MDAFKSYEDALDVVETLREENVYQRATIGRLDEQRTRFRKQVKELRVRVKQIEYENERYIRMFKELPGLRKESKELREKVKELQQEVQKAQAHLLTLAKEVKRFTITNP